MEEMIFKGNLIDFLDNKKIEILKLIKFGMNDIDTIFNEFQIITPSVDFDIPLDITILDNNNDPVYILKFSISGTVDILDYKPSTVFITMPEWIIRNNEIWFKIEETDIETTKVIINGLIDTFKSHLIDVAYDVREYNNNLRNYIQKLLNIYNNTKKNNKQLEEIKNYILFKD